MTHAFRTLFWLIVVATPAGILRADDPEILVLSVSSATEVDGLRIDDRQPARLRLDRSKWYMATDLGALLPSEVDVDALSVTVRGDLVVSTDIGFEHAGERIADEDLLLIRDGDLSVLFDGSDHGLPEAADIDAVHVANLDPLEIYYSVATPTEIGGTVYADDDILHWDGSHSLAVSGSDLFGAQRDRLDVDGLWVDAQAGVLLISTDVGFVDLGSVAAGTDDDVLRYRIASGAVSMFADLSEHGIDSRRVDIDALGDAGPHVFADGFESGGTTRWSLSVP